MAHSHLIPHDKLFRTTMVDPRIAREFFEQNLPADIKAIIDFATIQLQNESHIDDKLKLQITDLLYYAEFSGKPGYIYVLIEHQANPHKLMPFRLIKYMIAIMEDHLKKTKDDILPVIYPCIFYTGDRNYNYSTDLFDLFGDNKELAKGILLQPYQLIDLSKIPDEKLKEFLRYGVMARTMKHIYEKDFLVPLMDLIGDLRTIECFGEMDYIYTILSYIIKAGEIRDKQEFIRIIETGLTKINRGDIMTLAEQWKQEGIQEEHSKLMALAEQWKQESLEKGKQEGRQEGLQKGLQEGKVEAFSMVAMRLLNQGLNIEQIAAATGLTPKEVELLKNKSSN
ncbi:MAG: Rpn family recombination-promoting nuclease/putative transposase [bacterium]